MHIVGKSSTVVVLAAIGSTLTLVRWLISSTAAADKGADNGSSNDRGVTPFPAHIETSPAPTAAAAASWPNDVYSQRLERVIDYCLSHRVQLAARPVRPLRVASLGVWYCPIPKCASTAWKYFFGKVSSVECLKSEDREEIHLCVTVILRDVVADFVVNASVIVVRNPWLRLVSGYLDKVVIQRSYVARSCYEFNSVAISSDTPISFGQFITCITTQKLRGERVDEHFAVQFALCNFCERSTEGGRLIIVKVETMIEDFRQVLKAIGVTGSQTGEFYERIILGAPQESHEKKRASLARYRELYESLDNKTMALLTEIYRTDCEAFDYPLHPLHGAQGGAYGLL